MIGLHHVVLVFAAVSMLRSEQGLELTGKEFGQYGFSGPESSVQGSLVGKKPQSKTSKVLP
jgi:hypothetical protein